MWLAVPEDDQGMWWDDPIAADTEADIRKLATEKWAGNLPADYEVVIYRCHQEDVLELPKEDEAPEPEPERCPHTAAMLSEAS